MSPPPPLRQDPLSTDAASATATTQVEAKVRRFYNAIRELQADARNSHTKAEIRVVAEAAFVEALKAMLEVDAAKEKEREKARRAMRVRTEEVLREGEEGRFEAEVALDFGVGRGGV